MQDRSEKSRFARRPRMRRNGVEQAKRAFHPSAAADGIRLLRGGRRGSGPRAPARGGPRDTGMVQNGPSGPRRCHPSGPSPQPSPRLRGEGWGEGPVGGASGIRLIPPPACGGEG
jgi:hypothetical protein